MILRTRAKQSGFTLWAAGWEVEQIQSRHWSPLFSSEDTTSESALHVRYILIVPARAVKVVCSTSGDWRSCDPHCSPTNRAFCWIVIHGAGRTSKGVLFSCVYKWVVHSVSIRVACIIKPGVCYAPGIVTLADAASQYLLWPAPIALAHGK